MNRTAIGVAMGVAIGAAIGSATHNMGQWVALGGAIGVVLQRTLLRDLAKLRRVP